MKDPQIIEKAAELVEQYFGYVENNVHFTAYTPNVEAAAALIDELIPYLDYEKAVLFKVKKEKMLQTAERLRAEKDF